MESKKQYHNRMVKEGIKNQSICKHDYIFSILGDMVCICGKIEGDIGLTEKDLIN